MTTRGPAFAGPFLCRGRAGRGPRIPLTVARRAGLFHASLAQALLTQAKAARARFGEFTVGLGGGVFQNRLLTERVCARLAAAGFEVHLCAQVPCNDAGLSYGQVIEALYRETSGARAAQPA